MEKLIEKNIIKMEENRKNQFWKKKFRLIIANIRKKSHAFFLIDIDFIIGNFTKTQLGIRTFK